MGIFSWCLRDESGYCARRVSPNQGSARPRERFMRLISTNFLSHAQRVLFVTLTCCAMSLGCEAPGVGDPCDPENVPMGGFQSSEAYLETSSVQCRTRVCMVYELQGDTRCAQGSPDAENCVNKSPDCSPDDPSCMAQRVYCSCRCAAPAGSSTSTCECPDGYSCQEILELGGDGIRGSYCVKSDTISG